MSGIAHLHSLDIGTVVVIQFVRHLNVLTVWNSLPKYEIVDSRKRIEFN